MLTDAEITTLEAEVAKLRQALEQLRHATGSREYELEIGPGGLQRPRRSDDP